METNTIVGIVGVGMIAYGATEVLGRRRLRKRAAGDDADARAKLEKKPTVPLIILVAGHCVLLAAAYLDYQRLRTPLTPTQALDRAVRNLPRQ
jgi:hypothetical protein